MKTLIDNEYHRIELDNGIMIATWKISCIDLPAAKEASATRQALTSGQKYPLLVKMDAVKDSTKEAREFLASENSSEDLVAVALCVDSVLGDFISSFFVTVNKPLIPSKVFSDEKKAKEWLEQFIAN